MKESLFDIISKHANWVEEPNNDKRIIEEMKQAANIYGDSLISLGDRWIKAVEYDIEKICTIEPPQTHFNKYRQEIYRLNVFGFLQVVTDALKSHGFNINELDQVTQCRLGLPGRGTQIKDGLSKDEAGRLYNKFRKQGFSVHLYRELCSNLYTVIGYQIKTSPGTKKEPKTRKKPGAHKTYFKQFIVNKNETERVISIIKSNIHADDPAQSALLICGAIEAKKVAINVTPISIEREFKVNHLSIKKNMKKYREKRYNGIELEPYKKLFINDMNGRDGNPYA